MACRIFCANTVLHGDLILVHAPDAGSDASASGFAGSVTACFIAHGQLANRRTASRGINV